MSNSTDNSDYDKNLFLAVRLFIAKALARIFFVIYFRSYVKLFQFQLSSSLNEITHGYTVFLVFCHFLARSMSVYWAVRTPIVCLKRHNTRKPLY